MLHLWKLRFRDLRTKTTSSSKWLRLRRMRSRDRELEMRNLICRRTRQCLLRSESSPILLLQTRGCDPLRSSWDQQSLTTNSPKIASMKLEIAWTTLRWESQSSHHNWAMPTCTKKCMSDPSVMLTKNRDHTVNNSSPKIRRSWIWIQKSPSYQVLSTTLTSRLMD